MEKVYCECLESPLWRVVFGWRPDAHPAALTLSLYNTEGDSAMKKLLGQDKDKEITYQQLSQAEVLSMCAAKTCSYTVSARTTGE